MLTRMLLASLVLFSSCRTPRKMRLIEPLNTPATQGPVTIFVHGTLFPVIDQLVRHFDLPAGFNKARAIKRSFLHGRIAKILARKDPFQFPYDNFYYFGWCGALRFDSRHRAAEQLYEFIKTLPRPITLIGHSHGGNVILEVGRVAEERGDHDFYVDRIVLLATPIQTVTEFYAARSYFRDVYTIFSEGDTVQVSDPQGLYRISRRAGCHSILSRRMLHDAENIKQCRIKLCMKNPAHLDFIRYRFLTRLPQVLDIMRQCNRPYMSINLPANEGIPEIVE